MPRHGCSTWNGAGRRRAGQGGGAVAVRRHVYYSGTVQGVGFRCTAVKAARGRGLAGFVRNLRDGRVELVVEGEAGEVAAFLADVAETMGDSIRGVEAAEEPVGGEFKAFGVAY